MPSKQQVGRLEELLVGRRALSLSDRADIAVGIQAGKTDRQIGADLGRNHTIIWRERRRCRPQARKVETDPVLAARVRADLARSRTPRQTADRLRLEATHASVETMTKSPDAQGRTVSHEAIYR